ncbi:hypothetical protein BCR34DRAFT_592373 [Clohesyomyces aquaticus]|uniref:Uncharacterized protein n=1 Tax=Clohesyomyces aquaticus TaxID=1231657 RepID=A0A1Y1YU75_9PLEO|nr:hypothetical protein BCR34DRAFT_592373 [Clohesyomyces aquaticus]
MAVAFSYRVASAVPGSKTSTNLAKPPTLVPTTLFLALALGSYRTRVTRLGSFIGVRSLYQAQGHARVRPLGPTPAELVVTSGFLFPLYTFNEKADLCTEVELVVYLRSNPKQIVDVFEIRSNILDI